MGSMSFKTVLALYDRVWLCMIEEILEVWLYMMKENLVKALSRSPAVSRIQTIHREKTFTFT